MSNHSEIYWQEIEHTADWALIVWGDSLRALFEHTAQGMVSLVDAQANPEQASSTHDISLTAPDLETMLIDWLTELIYLMEDQHMCFSSIKVLTLDGLKIEAQVVGQAGASLKKHIKAATYHNLVIEKNEDGYRTEIVFDV